MTVPSLSVVVPVYNGGADLLGCLDSLETASARGNAIEVVLSDNHCTDGSSEVLASAARRNHWRLVRPNAHLPRQEHWQYAFGHATGTWLAMLHADDRLEPDGLGAYLAAAAAAPTHVVLLSGRYRELSEDGLRRGPARPSWLRQPRRVAGQELRARVLSIQNILLPFTAVRRSCFQVLGGFDTSYELLQDWDLWYRVLALGDAMFLPDVVGVWRQHALTTRYAATYAAEHRRFAARLRDLGGAGPVTALASRGLQALRARALEGSTAAELALRPLLAGTSLRFAAVRRFRSPRS